jgi:hypothetical protein
MKSLLLSISFVFMGLSTMPTVEKIEVGNPEACWALADFVENWVNKGRGAQYGKSFDHLDVTLNYTPERSPWSFGISGNNLLNISSRRASNFSPLNISDSRTFIMLRIVLFQVNYKL